MERRSPSCLSLMPRSEPHLPAAPQLLGLPLEPLLQGLGPQAIGVPGVQPFLAHPESASLSPASSLPTRLLSAPAALGPTLFGGNAPFVPSGPSTRWENDFPNYFS